MLQFINKESTRYALWPPLGYDTTKASNASERESRLPHQYLEQGGQELLCRQCPKSRGYEKPDRSGLDCRNTVGNGWDPGPPREGQHPTLGYKKLIDQGGRYSDVVTIPHHNTRNVWKAPSGKLRCTDSLHRYVTPFCSKAKVQKEKPVSATYNQTILRLHWLTPQWKGGGHDAGPRGGKWAV